jgi:hypothetical protein
MGIKEVISAPQKPWQNPFIERIIGSIRRECTDHVIVLNEGLSLPKTPSVATVTRPTDWIVAKYGADESFG